MPAADDAKTRSERKASNETPASGLLIAPGGRINPLARAAFSWLAKRKKIILYGIGVVVAIFALLSPTLFYHLPTTDLRVAGRTVSLEIASTQAEQQKGLGDRASMPTDHGMLFVFASPAKTCFWMKDMRFPLDMIWLNSAKQVVYLQQNVSPGTYPKAFCPPMAAKYVIELNAGQGQALGIRPGETLHL